MWVLDHLDDLESDFSVFHRVEDIRTLPGPRFFRLASRIFAYEGVMTARLMNEQQDTPAAPSARRRGTSSPPAGRDQVELSAMQAMHPGLIDRAEV